MKFSYMSIIFIGALISIVGGLLVAFGTYKENKSSSKKMDEIQTTGKNVEDKSTKQLNEIANLKAQNLILKSTIDSLNTKADNQENAIIEMAKQNTNLSLQLSKATQNLYGNLTGGDSYCEIAITPITPSSATGFVYTHGDFPVYEVQARIVDLDNEKLKKEIHTIDDAMAGDVLINVGELSTKTGKLLSPMNFDFTKDRKSFNIFYNARNGFFTQFTRMFKINNVWKTSVKIIDNKGKLLYEKHDSDIPADFLNLK
jgi:hypothetical protein